MKKYAISLLLIALLYIAPSYATEKVVLFISSYHAEFPWTEQCEQGLRTILTSAHVESIYMDTKRLPPSEFPKMADMAWHAYEEMHPDLVLIADDNALKLLGTRFADTQTPVVFLGINMNPRKYFSNGSLPINITGVLERPPLVGTVRFIGQILPNAHKVLILTENSQTSKAITDMMFGNKDKLKTDNITAEKKEMTSWRAWQEEVIAASEFYDAIILATYYNITDETGHYLTPAEVVEWISMHSEIPIFTNQDYAVGDHAAMGAYVIQGQTHGELAGKMAQRILDGTQPIALFPEVDQEGVFYFNQKQLNRFGITLPAQILREAIFK